MKNVAAHLWGNLKSNIRYLAGVSVCYCQCNQLLTKSMWWSITAATTQKWNIKIHSTRTSVLKSCLMVVQATSEPQKYMSDRTDLRSASSLNIFMAFYPLMLSELFNICHCRSVLWFSRGTFSFSHMTHNILPVRPPSLHFREVLLSMPSVTFFNLNLSFKKTKNRTCRGKKSVWRGKQLLVD